MKTVILSLLATVLSVLLVGCHSDKTPPDKYEQLSGIWEHQGYGEILVIGSEGIEEYDFTRKTCIKDSDPISRTEFDQEIDKINLSEDKNSFSALIQAPFITRFNKLNALPSSCHSDKIITESTPTAVFEHFWHTFNDYYAFFQKRGVDWQQQYDLYHPNSQAVYSQPYYKVLINRVSLQILRNMPMHR